MDPIVEALRILGLPPTASLEEATGAYKDLVRVWHPDRFPSDGRLRAKAEEQTRLLNRAIAHLRLTLNVSHTQSHPRPLPTQPPRGAQQPSESRPNFRTLELRKMQSHEVRAILMYSALLAVGLFNVTRLEGESSGSAQFALSALVIAYSLSHILFNVALLVCNTPIISINTGELRVLGLPRIPMTEIVEAWNVTKREEIYLRLLLTDAYLLTLPMQTRLRFKVVKFYQGFHTQIACGALDIHPSHVLKVIELANVYGAQPPTSEHHRRLSFAIHANTIATLTVLILVARCFIEHEGYEVALLPYLLIYLAARGYTVLESVVLARRG